MPLWDLAVIINTLLVTTLLHCHIAVDRVMFLQRPASRIVLAPDGRRLAPVH